MPLPLVFLAGVGIGILAGLLGVGGGALLVPLMVLGFGSSTKTASSNSLAIIFSIGVVCAAAYLSTGYIYLLSSLPPLIVGALVGHGWEFVLEIPSLRGRRGGDFPL
jgi:uncharacterized protein